MLQDKFTTEEEMIEYYLNNSDKIKEAFFGLPEPREQIQTSYTFPSPPLIDEDTHCRRFSTKHVQVKQAVRLCDYCNSSNLYDDEAHGDLVCLECATCMNNPLIDDAFRCMTYGDYGQLKGVTGNHTRRNCYKKMDYLSTIIRNINGYNMADVPQHIMQLISDTFRDQPMVSVNNVRSVLKANRLNKYYQRSAYISATLNEAKGHPKPKPLNHHEECMLRSLFNKFSYVFNKHKKQRKNSLNYQYVVYQLLRFIGRSDLQRNTKLLKCSKRMQQLNEFWREVCDETGWPFYVV